MLRPDLKSNKSMDDISSGIYNGPSYGYGSDRRARSSSPVKNRKSLPPNFLDMKLPSLPYANSDDLKSLSSNSSSGGSGVSGLSGGSNSTGTSSMSLDQIRKLSHSPISKRLHINTYGETNNQYVIPIPFTIKLPPKLSPKNKQKPKSAPQSPTLSPSSSPIASRRSPSPVRGSPRSKKHKSRLRQKKLVYTGNGYERLDTSSSDEYDLTSDSIPDTSFNSIPISKDVLSPPATPPTVPSKKQGPPSVTNNKRKSIKSVAQAKALNHDELSIIEEQSSSNSSSRNSSIRGRGRSASGKPQENMTRSLPPPPDIVEEDERSQSPVRFESSSQTTHTQPIPEPVPIQRTLEPIPQPIPTIVTPETSKPTGNINKKNTDKELPPIAVKGLPKYTTESNLNQLKNSNAPIDNSRGQLLKIHKRSFSDESHASSVSSFSTIGDVLSLTSRKLGLNPETPKHEQRKVSNDSLGTIESIESQKSSDSTISMDSDGSWNSLQQSVDLTIRESDSSFETTDESEDVTEESPEVPEQPEEKPLPPVQKTLVTSANQESETEVEDESEVADYYMDTTREKTPVEQSTQEEEDDTASVNSQDTIEFNKLENKDGNNLEKKDEYNEGAGRRFDFPNNFQNVTNSEITKKRILSTDSHQTNKTRFSYYSTLEGQIEIPDLSEASFSDVGSMRKSVMAVNGTTFNDLVSDNEKGNDKGECSTSEDETLEPIGVPSARGRRIATEQFNHLYQGNNDSDTDDSDVGSNAYSLYSSGISKSTPDFSSNSKKHGELPPLPIEKDGPMVPPKSQFLALPQTPGKSQAPQETQTPMRANHRRNYSRHSRHKSLGNIDFDINDLQNNPPSPSKPSKPEEMVLKVNEPPKPINYTIDFKNASKKENQLNTRHVTPTMNELRRVQTLRPPTNNSETDSSYQSSGSAKLSSSTDMSDTESITIDLTEETYDVCMVQRNNSTSSYKSVTEKFNGKEVEVVLVDEDEDLQSIYSKYGKNWLGRSESMSSNSSSNFSYNSMASETQLKLKQLAQARTNNIIRDKNIQRSNNSLNSNSSTGSKYRSSRIKLPSQRASPSKSTEVSSTKAEVSPTKGPAPPAKGPAPPAKGPVPPSKAEASPSKGAASPTKIPATPTKAPVSPAKVLSPTKPPLKITPTMQKSMSKPELRTQNDEDKYFDYTKSSSYYDFNTFLAQKNQASH